MQGRPPPTGPALCKSNLPPNTTPRSCAVDIGFQNCQLVLTVGEIEQGNMRNESTIGCFGSNNANHPVCSFYFVLASRMIRDAYAQRVPIEDLDNVSFEYLK